MSSVAADLAAWRAKPLLREVYAAFYRRIDAWVAAGRILEIGSGVGNFKELHPDAIASDRFVEPWLDLAGDAYAMPLRDGCVSSLVLFDVFHHLAAPNAFLSEARRVLAPGGRVILFEPFVSLASWPVYGLLHPEPVAMRAPIDLGLAPKPGEYAAQGNATRLFFRDRSWLRGWRVMHAEAFSAFAYVLSGGFSKPAVYPRAALPVLHAIDGVLSRWPRLFASRCLIVLTAD